MGPLAKLIRQGERTTLNLARTSQALVIAGVDRFARSESGRPRILGRLWGVQLDVAGALSDEPARLIDGAYAQAQQLLMLHQEFAHRVLEAMDARELPIKQMSANVITLAPRLGKQA